MVMTKAKQTEETEIVEKPKRKYHRVPKEYKELQRKQYEQKGIWIPLNQKSDYMIYYKE